MVSTAPGTQRLWADINKAGPRPFAYLGSADKDSDELVREEHARRRSFIANFGYAVPAPHAIDAIVDFVGDARVIEVCAGKALWAHLLADRGIHIRSTDAAPPACTFREVVRADAGVAVDGSSKAEILLLCWPPHNKPVATSALRAFRGDRLVFIGDPRFTADQAFHDRLTTEWRLFDRVYLPSWPGLQDCVMLWDRENQTPRTDQMRKREQWADSTIA